MEANKQMTLDEAKIELTDLIDADGSVSLTSPWIFYKPGEHTACLDGDFTPDELEAMAVYMRFTQAAMSSTPCPGTVK